MKNLHLMPMGTHIDEAMVIDLNVFFPHDENVFISRAPLKSLIGVDNYKTDPSAFSVQYINSHHKEFRRIIIHSMFLSEYELLQLTDEAAKKIVWVVWGQDLYDNSKKPQITAALLIKNTIHFFKKLIRGTYLKAYIKRIHVAKKVSKFYCVGIGFLYDEKQIRKRFGNKVNVKYLPVSGYVDYEKKQKYREQHLKIKHDETNVLVGHSGYHFLEHEKYLRKLSKYKNENIHINLVLCYGSTPERTQSLRELAYSLFGEEKCTVKTELMTYDDYFEFLSTIDIAIFPFRHQAALGSAIGLAFMGTKLFLNPRGVLSNGFRMYGIKTYDCHQIGRLPFSEFNRCGEIADVNSPLFDMYSTKKNKRAWASVLQ